MRETVPAKADAVRGATIVPAGIADQDLNVPVASAETVTAVHVAIPAEDPVARKADVATNADRAGTRRGHRANRLLRHRRWKAGSST